MGCFRGVPSWGVAGLLLGALLSACSSSAGSADRASGGVTLPPSVQGGQTGALGCGPTPAAEAGGSIPGGSGGIVLQTAGCAEFDAATLSLLDEGGEMVEFDVEPLDGGYVLIRPRVELEEGVYQIGGPGTEPADVRVGQPAELPSTLGVIEPAGDGCDPVFQLTVDPLVQEYLPQLKLSVRVDDGPSETWFDFGALRTTGGRASLALPTCLSRCLNDGEHELELTGELAGELGTLEPLSLPFHQDCGGDDAGGCSVATTTQRRPWPLLLLLAAALGLRRRRRGRPPG